MGLQIAKNIDSEQPVDFTKLNEFEKVTELLLDELGAFGSVAYS
jgi:hypothetical protein